MLCFQDVRSRLEACTPGDITTTTTTTTSNSVDSVTLLEQQTPSSSQITPSHTPPIVYSSPPLRRRASTIDKHFSNNYDNTSTQLQNLSDRYVVLCCLSHGIIYITNEYIYYIFIT